MGLNPYICFLARAVTDQAIRQAPKLEPQPLHLPPQLLLSHMAACLQLSQQARHVALVSTQALEQLPQLLRPSRVEQGGGAPPWGRATTAAVTGEGGVVETLDGRTGG